jgi:hypothetical protein
MNSSSVVHQEERGMLKKFSAHTDRGLPQVRCDEEGSDPVYEHYTSFKESFKNLVNPK